MCRSARPMCRSVLNCRKYIITGENYGTTAKKIAEELKTKAIHGIDYTIQDCERDMERPRLYALTDERLKQTQ